MEAESRLNQENSACAVAGHGFHYDKASPPIYACHCLTCIASHDVVIRLVQTPCMSLMRVDLSLTCTRREFVLKNYAEMKAANPLFPILIREALGAEAKLVARYGE